MRSYLIAAAMLAIILAGCGLGKIVFAAEMDGTCVVSRNSLFPP